MIISAATPSNEVAGSRARTPSSAIRAAAEDFRLGRYAEQFAECTIDGCIGITRRGRCFSCARIHGGPLGMGARFI